MTEIFLAAASVALLAIAAAGIYSILLMKDLQKVLNELESTVKQVSDRALPVLDNAEVITGKVRSIAENLDGEFMSLKGAVDSVVNAVNDIVDLEKKVKGRIESPVLDVANYIAAVAKGIKAFLHVLKS
ncbi:MAG: hypothetical protein ACP5US_01515 [Candidatus Kryptoniota bacterium]